jgi:hypothetical protein
VTALPGARAAGSGAAGRRGSEPEASAGDGATGGGGGGAAVNAMTDEGAEAASIPKFADGDGEGSGGEAEAAARGLARGIGTATSSSCCREAWARAAGRDARAEREEVGVTPRRRVSRRVARVLAAGAASTAGSAGSVAIMGAGGHEPATRSSQASAGSGRTKTIPATTKAAAHNRIHFMDALPSRPTCIQPAHRDRSLTGKRQGDAVQWI